MKRLSDIFDIYSGSSLDFGKQVEDYNGINFVSRNSNNNGVVGRVQLDTEMKIYRKGDITVPLGGSYLLSAFVQDEDFVTAQNVAVLRPKNYMKEIEKWFYCYVLRENRFKFSAFGREVNKYLRDIEVPDEIPNWVYEARIETIGTNNINNKSIKLEAEHWQYFKLSKLFNIHAGKYYATTEYSEGETPHISATLKNNGVNKEIDLEPDFNGNTITTEKIWSTAFYQPDPYCATSDNNIFNPKFNLNVYIGLFIATVINFNENFRWNYGRQCRVGDSKKITIKLPIKTKINSNGEKKPLIDKNKKYSEKGFIPDFEFMENYMKNLSFADAI